MNKNLEAVRNILELLCSCYDYVMFFADYFFLIYDDFSPFLPCTFSGTMSPHEQDTIESTTPTILHHTISTNTFDLAGVFRR